MFLIRIRIDLDLPDLHPHWQYISCTVAMKQAKINTYIGF
jgi:hypothetical protein